MSLSFWKARKEGPFAGLLAVIRGIQGTLTSPAQTPSELENFKQGFMAASITTRLLGYLTHDRIMQVYYTDIYDLEAT
jgi:hypothetical protein